MSWELLASPAAFKFYYSVVGLFSSGKFGHWIYKAYMRRKVYSIEEVQKNQLQIYKAMEDIVVDTSACKVLMLSLSNGGSKPAVGKTLYSSVLYEVNKSDMTPRLASWNRQKIDLQYAQMLVDIMLHPEKKTTVKTEDMSQGLLKNVYETDGIKQSKVLYLHRYEPSGLFSNKEHSNYNGKTWYLSVVFDHDNDLTVVEIDKIRSSTNAIANILKAQYKYE